MNEQAVVSWAFALLIVAIIAAFVIQSGAIRLLS